MNSGDLARRLARLEAARRTAPVRLTSEKTADAARRYEATLYEESPRMPAAETYFATATVQQLAADYDAMLKGAPAPWE